MTIKAVLSSIIDEAYQEFKQLDKYVIPRGPS